MAPRLVVVLGGSRSVLNPGELGVDGALFSESSMRGVEKVLVEYKCGGEVWLGFQREGGIVGSAMG